jgi:hypothetical protein
MGKEWNEMTADEIMEGFKTGAIRAGAGGGERAFQRLRMLWREEDSRLAQSAKNIAIVATVIAGLTFLATMGWWVWTFYVWTRGECV